MTKSPNIIFAVNQHLVAGREVKFARKPGPVVMVEVVLFDSLGYRLQTVVEHVDEARCSPIEPVLCNVLDMIGERFRHRRVEPLRAAHNDRR